MLRLIVSTYHHLGRIEEAVALCEANPDPAGADAGLAGAYAMVFLDADRQQLAGEWAAKALAGNPRSVDGLIADGTLNIVRARTDVARQQFDLALGLDRNFAETHGGLASVAAIRGQRAEAERLIEVAQRLDPKCLSAQFARSVLLDQGGKGGEARRVIVRTARNVMSERPTVLGRVIENATGR